MRSTARIFLLSPANLGGIRAGYVLNPGAGFDLASRLRRDGLPLGELFSFISGLYFRGKVAYAGKAIVITEQMVIAISTCLCVLACLDFIASFSCLGVGT